MTDRIFDKGLENNVRGMVDEHVKDSKAALMKAGTMMQDKQKGFEDSVAQKPYMWVAGAFLAGIVLAKMLNRAHGDR